MGCNPKKNSGLKERYDNFIDALFAKAGEKIDEKIPSDIITTTKEAKIANEFLREHRVAVANIYQKSGEIHDFLSKELTDEESVEITRALNGDSNPMELPSHLRELYATFRKTIDSNADELVELGALAEKNKIADYLKRYYTKHMEERKGVRSILLDKFKKRKNLTEDERIALGMIEDSAITVSKTIAEQSIQIEKAKVLKSIAERFGKDEEFEGAVLIPDTTSGGVYKYGALAGKYVTKEVASALDEANLVRENVGLLEKYWYPVIDHIKVNMTVKNPPTHLYNIGSNVNLAYLNGDLKALGEVLYLKVKKPEEFKSWVKKANKYGLDSMLDDMEIKDLDFTEGEPVVLTILKNLYMAEGTKWGKNIRTLYEWEDKIFKLAGFKRLVESGMDELEAFKKSSDVYVDYATPLPKTIRVLDKSGIFPFLHYTYKSTPATLKVVMKNPVKFGLMQAGIGFVGASAWFNDDDDVVKPDWAKDQLNMFGVKEWVDIGDGFYLNAGRMIPAMKFGGMDFSLDTGFGFVGGAINIIGQGKTSLGYNFTSKYDEDWEKVGKKILVMGKSYLPPMTFGRYGQGLIGVALNEAVESDSLINKDSYGNELGALDLAKRSVGVRYFDEEKEAKKKIKTVENERKYRTKENPKMSYKELIEANKKKADIRKKALKQGVRVF
jgi:hypothetical protein